MNTRAVEVVWGSGLARYWEVSRASRLGRTMAASVIAATIAVVSLLPQAPPAYAERDIRYINGYRCESTIEHPLGKFVCRNPSNPWRDGLAAP